MYEDPNIAIQKFVTEIDPKAIISQKVIGVGKGDKITLELPFNAISVHGF